MLPGEIQTYLQSHPGDVAGYQNFQNWVAAGAKHPSWSAEAAAAAHAAGITEANPNVVRSAQTVWGEGLNYDAGGNVVSGYNSGFIPWLQAWDAAHPGYLQGSTAPAAPPPPGTSGAPGAPPPQAPAAPTVSPAKTTLIGSLGAGLNTPPINTQQLSSIGNKFAASNPGFGGALLHRLNQWSGVR